MIRTVKNYDIERRDLYQKVDNALNPHFHLMYKPNSFGATIRKGTHPVKEVWERWEHNDQAGLCFILANMANEELFLRGDDDAMVEIIELLDQNGFNLCVEVEED
jgi:hypothetical protein